jgi:uncharacterized protein (TIRG00374 family)
VPNAKVDGALLRRLGVKALIVALSLGLLWLTFGDVRVVDVERLFAGGGLYWLALPVPLLLAQLLDASAYQVLLAHLGLRVPFRRALMAQVAGESATLALPMGFLVGESVRPWLLSIGQTETLPKSVAGATGRKLLLVFSEGFWILATLLLAFGSVVTLSQRRFGGAGLIWLSVGVAAALMIAATLLALSLYRAQFASALFTGLTRLLPSRLARALGRRQATFERTDEELHHIFSLKPVAWVRPACHYIGVWLLEGLEAYLILRLLGASVDLSTVLYVEALVATLRALIPIAPAGLGIQDAGYAAFFAWLGVPAAPDMAAAFCLTKRTREFVFCMLGGTCFVLARRWARARAPVVSDFALGAQPGE